LLARSVAAALALRFPSIKRSPLPKTATMAAPSQFSGVPAEHAAFEQLVSVLMSPDNAARAAGEAQFAGAKASSPDGLCAGLLSVLTSSASVDSRAFCAVLLRKVRGWRRLVVGIVNDESVEERRRT